MALPPFELLLGQLLLRLLWGSWFCLFLVSRRESSERFLRIASLVTDGLALPLCVYLFWRQHTLGPLGSSLLLLSIGAAIYSYFSARPARIAGFALILMAPLYALWGSPLANHFNFLTSALLLGGFFGSQFVGHWFLNVPGMDIRELKKCVRVLFAGLALKSLECAWTLWGAWQASNATLTDVMGRPFAGDVGQNAIFSDINAAASFFDLKGSGYMGLGLFGWLLLAMRLLWGLIAPWILAFMIRATVNTRSTQSATGILYAACVLVLIGEGSALYLTATLGWPL